MFLIISEIYLFLFRTHVNIDMNTVRFCTPEQMKKFEKQVWMSGFEKTGKEGHSLNITKSAN